MKLQQILVEATDFTSPQGNKIVAQSPGIDPDLAATMSQWATVRAGLQPGRVQATFFTKLDRRLSVLGRSFAGNYDSHGDRHLYSQLILLQSSFLRSYDNNVVLFARHMNSSGAWMLPPRFHKRLPEISLPETTINPFQYAPRCEETDEIKKSLRLHDQIAITNVLAPLVYVGSLLNSLEFKNRPRMSFAIGRRIMETTSFQINFFPGADLHLDRELTTKQVYSLRPTSELAASGVI